MKKPIDLRSDTVTKPTAEMLETMLKADVGDDVFMEDSAVIELETYAASLFGTESALFCPSGTMTNQIAIKVHTSSPGEVICDELSHIYQYEGGGIGFNSGLSTRLIKGERGLLTAKDIKTGINPDDVHKAPTQLVSLENTCNKGGGSVYDLSVIAEIRALCSEMNLPLHLDGARLMNAIIAKNQDPKFYGQHFDSISLCLSKGLGAPVGSLLLGSNEFIKKSRRIRKIFGGGMRQAGYLASAGLYALNHQSKRLQKDHDLAQELLKLVIQQNYIVDSLPVETNIIVFELENSIPVEKFLNHLKAEGILAVPFGGQMIRFVTHLDVNEGMLEEVENALNSFSACN